ncbi:MAG: hypothetical protein M1825_005858 [Sarcosagium campestre]|nr:MAG: hypothetical protein M1825_005858 [Sarcosagium campestre]
MQDPLPPPPAFLRKLTQPLADYLALTTLPLHIHEVLFAFTCYHVINTRVSPWISARLFPNTYPQLSRKTRINWDVHVVSLCQSTVINVLALWVLWTDQTRVEMDWRERVWGYTGAGGMIQGFAAGYFLWDLFVSTANVASFGWGMLAHAVCALIVFSFGFRPFVNYYGPTFILYELSSPFLNFHWFFDKLNMTGSRAQLYNGIVLLVSFFFCRLLWGTYQSLRVYQDVWAALQSPGPVGSLVGVTDAASDPLSSSQSPATDAVLKHAFDPTNTAVMRFAGPQTVPFWLATTYLASNVVLNTLNFYWFGKMIEAVRKRFRGPKAKSKVTPTPTSIKKLEPKEPKEKREGSSDDDDDDAEIKTHQNGAALSPSTGAGAKLAPELDSGAEKTILLNVNHLENDEGPPDQATDFRRRRA